MSYNPNALAAKDATGAGCLPSHALPHPAQLARFLPMLSPQLYMLLAPARAAYSHSDSVGRRYCFPVSRDSHRT